MTVQFKHVPGPPATCDRLAAVQQAVPETPQESESCCALVVDQTAIDSTDTAWIWLSFCRALGLVTNTERGLKRSSQPPTASAYRESFRTRVYGVDAVLEALSHSTTPQSSADIVATLEQTDSPARKRLDGHRLPSDVQTHVRNVLEWAVCFEFVQRVGDRYATVQTT